ncbi:MAG: efflux RND transporter periplasmic adaptor subunit [Deltaproteobacteria bacterium]|nr:efflux RND transporter periplasmic adaptor subunit [Deltaproteobacteria bacterium]
MIKRYMTLMLAVTVTVAGIGCGQRQEAAGEQNLSQSQETAAGQDTERPQIKPLRKGEGPRAGGRGLGRTDGRGMRRTDGITLTGQEKEAVEIRTTMASLQPLKSELTAMGKVIARQNNKAIVSYAFPARISQIHIKIGDWVKKGKRLVTLQSEEVGNAKSDFYKAQADFELTQVSYERQQRLFDRGVGAKKDSLTAEADLKVAQASLEAAEKKLHVLGFSEQEVATISESHQINPIITLYSPISGKIIQNNAVLGSMIDQATEILVVMDPSVLWIDAEIYEKDIAKVRLGMTVELSVPAYPGETFSGKVTYIGDVLREDTRTITVRAEVENRDYRLKPGMFASIRIALNHQSQALVVPQEAVLEDKGDKIAFIKRGGQFFLQVVHTGARENGNIEILRGLAEGDEVVVTGGYQLKSKLYEEILKSGHIH